MRKLNDDLRDNLGTADLFEGLRTFEMQSPK